ncbi:Peptide transporter, putative [Ricinus communis]|uniref:Peptide transporter, putative n=1 Tax=Ricinus communis TaxID=3988 RepID=B9RGA9_RICCO|nr:Peptide transporter, putative [Ricinus communis]
MSHHETSTKYDYVTIYSPKILHFYSLFRPYPNSYTKATMDSTVSPVTIEEDGHELTDMVSTSKRKGGWNSAIFIILLEVAERFAFYGVAGNLITYLTNDLHQPTAAAAKNINTWIGVSSIFPILGAFIADSFLGRFKTILFASIIYFTGMVLLTLSVSVVPTHHREMAFFIALYILAIGEGGHKPCVQTFAADQFDEEKPEEKAAKSSFFNWWYLSIAVGATVAVFVVIYIQDNVGWTEGSAMLAGVLVVALMVFLMGIKRYRIEAPCGSPYTTVAQVFVAAAKKQRVSETREGWGLCCVDEKDGADDLEGQPKVRVLARTKQFRFLDKAMIIDNIDISNKTRNPWRLCTLNQVEEVKQVLRLIPIWLSCLMFTAIIVQTHTFFIKQGSTMIRSIGPHFLFPPASLQSLTGMTILIAVPIYDKFFVPIARKITGHPSGITMLQRIGIGLFLSILEMVVAALVEAKRVSTAFEHGLIDTPKAIVPMAVWWLLPQYMISGLADVFTVIGLQELFYDQMPVAMRSMGAAAYISIIGIGSFINSAVISVVQAVTSRRGHVWLGDNVNRSHLDYFYWVLAVLSALNLCVYVWIASGFVYKKVEGDHEEKEMEEKEKGVES